MIVLAAWVGLGLANYALLCWYDHKNMNSPSGGVVGGVLVLSVLLGPVMWLLTLFDVYEERQQRRAFEELAKRHRQASVSQTHAEGGE